MKSISIWRPVARDQRRTHHFPLPSTKDDTGGLGLDELCRAHGRRLVCFGWSVAGKFSNFLAPYTLTILRYIVCGFATSSRRARKIRHPLHRPYHVPCLQPCHCTAREWQSERQREWRLCCFLALRVTGINRICWSICIFSLPSSSCCVVATTQEKQLPQWCCKPTFRD